jgi:hypothetical protein
MTEQNTTLEFVKEQLRIKTEQRNCHQCGKEIKEDFFVRGSCHRLCSEDCLKEYDREYGLTRFKGDSEKINKLFNKYYAGEQIK